MTVRQIVATAMRIFALWMILFSIQSAGVMTFAYSDSPWWMVLSGILLGLAIMVFLWRFADPIARRLVPAESSDRVAGITHSGLFQTGCCLIGLGTVAGALPEVMRAVAWIILSAGPANVDTAPQTKLMLLVGLAKLGVGLFLLLRSSDVIRIVRFDS